LVAHFISDTFTVTVTAEPPEGGTVEGGGTEIPYLTEITVIAHPDSCYDFMGWFEGDNLLHTDTVYTFPVTGDRDLTALFEMKLFIVTAFCNPPEGGILSFDTLYAACGDSITINVTPNIGYHFLNWTLNDSIVSTNTEYGFFVFDSCHLVANFEYLEYLIKLEKDFIFGGTVDTAGIYPLNYELTVHARANPEYQFVKWTEGTATASTEADYKFTVTSNRTLTAIFEPATFDVVLEADPGSGGNVDGGGTDIPYNEWITITAESNDYFVFVNWTHQDGTWFSNDSVYSFPVQQSLHLIAHFVPATCIITLSANPGTGGSFFGSGAFPVGTIDTIRAFPNSNYTFDNWTNAEDGSVFSPENPHHFTVMKSMHLVANFLPKGYLITVSAESPNGGTATGGGIFQYQELDTVWAHAYPNYVFVEWRENDLPVSSDSIYIFPVTQSRHLVAHFRLKAFNVEVSANPWNGGMVEGGGYNIPWGTDTTVYAYPFTNYDFVNWTENGEQASGVATYSFSVTESRNLVANFTPKNYTITLDVSHPGMGTVHGAGVYAYMDMATIEADANPGYAFVCWKENGETIPGAGSQYTFPVNSSRTLVAHFDFASYSVIVTAEPEEGGSAEETDYNLSYGAFKTVRADANPLYYFKGWYEDDIMVYPEAVYTFQVTASRYLVAKFGKETRKITLISLPFPGGTLSGGGDIEYETEHTITAKANDCYEFIEWTDVNNKFLTDELYYNFTVEEDCTFLAHFRKINVDVTTSANPPEGGIVSGEYFDIVCDTEVTIEARANPEYTFVNWTRNGEEVSNSPTYTFHTQGGDFVANFASNEYTITLIADPPELGLVTGEGDFPYGTEHTVHAIPVSGYSLVAWTEDSVEVSTVPDYTFVIERSRTLTAHFEKTMYVVTVLVNDTLYGNATGGGKYSPNEKAQLKAFSKEGYQFSNWTINDTIVSTSSMYEFPVTKSVTIVANFYGLDFDTYAATLWDNTFMLNLNKLAEDKYEIVGCRWFKNGMEEVNTNTLDEFSYSAGPNPTDLLELEPAWYMYRLITKNGSELYSTKKVLTEYSYHYTPGKAGLLVYPNPAQSGNAFRIENVTKEYPIEVYNQLGICVSRSTATDDYTILTLHLPAGVYIIRNHNKEAKVTIIK
jgi:hypothetical protein